MNKNSNTAPVYFAIVEGADGDVQVTQNRDTPELAAQDAEALIANEADVDDWDDYSVQIVSLVASSEGWKKPTKPVLKFHPPLAELVLKGKV